MIEGGKIPVPFFSADIVDLAIEWRALFHGAIDGKIRVEHPGLNFVKGPTEATSQTHINSCWTDVFSNLMPLKINRLEIIGQVLYNAFIQALYPSLENSFSLNSVKTQDADKKPRTFLGKIFHHSKGKKDKNDKNNKDNKKD